MGEGSWVVRLGALPGREGEELGLLLAGGEVPRVVRLVWLADVEGEARERLAREVARGAEALHHPNIQAPLVVEAVDGGLAVVMEHADGETLQEILAVGGRLPPAIAARVVRDACAAIHFAHEEGQDDGPFVHGWLRPENLLVSRSGVTLVSGFGAGSARPAASLLPWQSPEQVLGGPRAASRQSDVYLLGLVLHACLAGENPFEGEADREVAILSRPPPSLEPLGVPPALAAVARRAMAVKAADRFASADELARAVDEAVADMATPAALAAWVESLFPGGMGVRAQRQRSIDAALQAARTRATGAVPAAGRGPGTGDSAGRAQAPEGAPEEIGEEHILDEPGPRGEGASDGLDELRTGQFQLAAPPFPSGAPRTAAPAQARPAPAPPPPAPAPPPSPAAAKARVPPAPPSVVGPADIVGEGPGHVDRPVAFSPLPEPSAPARTGFGLAVAGVAAAGLLAGWWLSGFPAGPDPAARVAPPAADLAPAPGAITPAAPATIPASLAAETAPHRPAAPGARPEGPRTAPASPAPTPAAPAASPGGATRAPSAKGSAMAALPILEVTASEQGELFVDGKRAGRPPLQRPVAAGRREVRLLDANLGLDVSRTVEVRPPRTELRIEVGKGRLTVRAPEGAEIAVDGRPVARGSVRDLEVWEGRHRIEVTLGSARDQHDFRVGAGQTYDYDVTAVSR